MKETPAASRARTRHWPASIWNLVSTALLPPQSEAAQQTLKDPYVFDFLTLGPDAQERDLERGLLQHVRDFLLELGVGFAFVGSQVRLVVDGEDFFLDLLFFHLKLRCFVVIELKTGEFKPEYAGKMNFYLSAVDAQLRHDGDAPSIGLVLCKEIVEGIWLPVELEAAQRLKDARTAVGELRLLYRVLGEHPVRPERPAHSCPRSRRTRIARTTPSSPTGWTFDSSKRS